MKQDLQEAIQVASSALIFKSNWVAFFSLLFRQREEVCTIFGLPVPAGEDCALFDSGEDLLWSVEQFVKHFIKYIFDKISNSFYSNNFALIFYNI